MDDTHNLIEEVQQLVWALVDDLATEEQVRRLETLVLEHAEARRAYAECMALHAELHCLLAAPRPVTPVTAGNAATPRAIPGIVLAPPAVGGSPQTA
jgi:hypothetical protein